MKEHIHIGMPVFNGESHLQEALESLLNQSYANFEIFIVNNASTDSTQDIIQHYAKLDSRIKIYRESQWVSATANWNRSYELASRGAEVFMWASDDDLWARDYIESLLSPLIKNSRVVLSFSEANEIDEEGRTVSFLYRKRFPKGQTAFERIRSVSRCGRYAALHGLLRTTPIHWTPILTETSFGPDLWFLIRLATAGEFHMVRRPLFYKRKGGICETGEDPSASHDPLKTWNIGDEEWKLISELKLNPLAKSYLYYRLKLSAKVLFPQTKRIDWFLYPIFWSYMFTGSRQFFKNIQE